MANIVVLTGAGISAESGIPTFRDSHGLWEEHRIEDVASHIGWKRNPELVWNFYKKRQEALLSVQPNRAHYVLVELEQYANENGHDFCIVTQNIDGLHQKAGSKKVIELHGDLKKLRCETCGHIDESESKWGEKEIPICPSCGDYLRVNVVWFGELLIESYINEAILKSNNANIFLIIGTSGQVYPAASLVNYAFSNIATVIECNPEPAFASYSMLNSPFYYCYRGKARTTVPLVVDEVIKKILNKK